ncbi:myotubularin-related protein 9-like [Montipora capricornis]|uniref:myotubularin-related protein 9-like n=1 Tax=Montipora capricornis TaxID=246305 RepID=UPI0035F20DF5
MDLVDFIKSPKVDNVSLRRRGCPHLEGTLVVTGHHLIFSSRTDHIDELILLHSAVEHVEKKAVGQQGTLTLCCKNFDTIKLRFNNIEEALNVASSIDILSTIENTNMKYPFFYRHLKAIDEDGWELFNTEVEFSKLVALTQQWRISHANSNFELCPSYPASVVVPKNISDDTLKASSQFRQLGRFPVLSYYHKNGVVMLRCSQPLTTMGGKRSREDEKLVNATLGSELKGVIIDTRSQAAAMNSRTKGGGVELESNYPQWRRVYQNIERYSVLNDSVAKLVEGSLDPKLSMNSWLSKLESSSWLDHVQSVLSTAFFAARCLDIQGTTVLVHGDAGTDATLQVTSLVQVLLDPYCRTAEGFKGLIDREWLRGGHPFAQRCVKVGVSPSRYKGQGPVFLLFLDCVWQVYQQFPCSFEFNDRFLITLFEHAYSSQFGTFLCNNEADRLKSQLKTKTISLWSHLNESDVLKPLLNPMYEPNDSVLWPSVASQSLVLWPGLFLKWRESNKNEDVLWQEVRRIQQINTDLKSKAISLRREYVELQAKVLEGRSKWQEEKENREKTDS